MVDNDEKVGKDDEVSDRASTTLDPFRVYWVSFAGVPLQATVHEERLREDGMDSHTQRPSSLRTVNPCVTVLLYWTMFDSKIAARALIEYARPCNET